VHLARRFFIIILTIVNGTDIPSLPTEIERGKEAAQRLANNLALLEQHFPIGFGPFANNIRNW